jgi:endonuclease/exonuclease/phosphatase family metal-dependent hydrolase
MRIGTYNVLGLTGYPVEEAARAIGAPGEATNCDHFAAVFEGLQCDVLALQEGVAARIMQQIGRAIGRHVATFPSPVSWPGHVLSRYPILESRVFSHAIPAEETPPFSRCFGATLMEVSPGVRLWVVNVHLHPSDRALRDQEAGILADRLVELQAVTDHVIVLGDFNSEIDEEVHRAVRSLGYSNAMEQAGGGIRYTMDTAGTAPHAIDHIYVSSSLGPRLRSATVVRGDRFRHDGPKAGDLWVHSDHLPVVAELEAGASW